MTALQAAISLAFTGIGVALAIHYLQSPVALALATGPERIAGSCAFFVTVGQCTYVGLFGNSMRQTLQQRSEELRLAYKRIEELAQTDELTGLPNRRCIAKMLDLEIARGLRGAQFSIALIDIDWFKRINDRFGHSVGDEVLRIFAIAAVADIRKCDRLGRYGGEEFLFVLPDTPHLPAASVLERLRVTISERDWSVLAGMTVTISAGVATFQPNDSPESILERADRALYAAKARGRNRIVSI
jgi:diguanylate cyclase (GGDEF)-like protein